MTHHVLQCTIQADTLLPQDAIVNTFHFQGGVSPDYEDLVDMVHAFYTVAPSGGTALATYLGGNLLNDTINYRIYDFSDSVPRSPVWEEDRSASFGGGTTLPPEVAVCLSFQGTKVSGIAQARRRGRIFIGPLSTSINPDGRPSSTFRTSLAGSARDLLIASNASGDWDWQVYSPTSSTSTNVVDGWVDNEFDTQRRRGRTATTRTVWDDSTP